MWLARKRTLNSQHLYSRLDLPLNSYLELSSDTQHDSEDDE